MNLHMIYKKLIKRLTFIFFQHNLMHETILICLDVVGLPVQMFETFA